jgi:hypothetical protein
LTGPEADLERFTMSHEKPIHLPHSAQRFFHECVSCPHCHSKIGEQGIYFVGAGRTSDGAICLAYRFECPACQKRYSAIDRMRPFTRPDWWNELAQWYDATLDDTSDDSASATRPKKRRGSANALAPKNSSESAHPPFNAEPVVERPEFYARNVSVLNCTGGNFDHAEGEPASIITLSRVMDGEISPWAISIRDSKLLAVKLLIALATNDDAFAQHLLDQHFPADEEGDFIWPDQPYQLF